MRRFLFTLVAFTALAAWAGAQAPPAPLPAAVQVKLFKDNRILIENLVDHGIDLANTGDSLGRAEACRQTARTLANYLERAAGDQNPDRAAELAGLFGEVVREGLVPNLDAAQQAIRPGDPREAELQSLRAKAADLDGVRPAIPSADNPKAKAALASLDALRDAIKPKK